MGTYRDGLIKKFCAGIPLESLVQALKLGITALTLIQEMVRKQETDDEQHPVDGRRTTDSPVAKMADGNTGASVDAATRTEPDTDSIR